MDIRTQDEGEAVQTENEAVDKTISAVISRLSPLLLACKNTPHELLARKTVLGVQIYALKSNSKLRTEYRNVNIFLL